MQALSARGVKDVFFLPGGGCMYLVDALSRTSELNPVALLHEQSVGIAAEAYAQFNGGLGVAIVTSGPGATNAITPLAAAFTDSTPLLIISGQVKTADLRRSEKQRQNGFQELPICPTVTPLTKKAYMPLTPQEAVVAIDEGINLALSARRGPVWIDIPLDVQSSSVPWAAPELIPLVRQSQTFLASEGVDVAIDSVITSLSQSRRPLLLLGNGARASALELRQFCELLTLPFALTWKAMDLFPDDDPLFVGRPGAIATRYANFAQQSADWFLAVGARMDSGQVGYRLDNLAPHAQRFVIDVDGSELEKFPSREWTCIRASADYAAATLLRKSETIRPPETQKWLQRINEWKTTHRLQQVVKNLDSSRLTTYDVVEAMSESLRGVSVFVPGSSGASSEVFCQAFQVSRNQRILNSQGLGAMGFGVPAAIGACIASGRHLTICIDGDGGFVMNVQELSVIKAMSLPIVFIVLNNAGYASIRSTQDRFFAGRRLGTEALSGLHLPDIESVGRGFGIETHTIASSSELVKHLRLSVAKPRPLILNVQICPESRTQLKIGSQLSDDGKILSDGLENLQPYLPPEKLLTELRF